MSESVNTIIQEKSFIHKIHTSPGFKWSYVILNNKSKQAVYNLVLIVFQINKRFSNY